jgi:hypothetical protein
LLRTRPTCTGKLVTGAFALPQPLQGLGVDALRTGTYGKTLTFTLSTTNP